jgi:hypothetical protein
MDLLPKLLIPLLCLASSLLVGFFARRVWRKNRLIVRTPTSRIGDLRPGFAEAKGRLVAPGETLVSPMTRKKCLYYHFRVEQRRTVDSKRQWVTVVDDLKANPCQVDDGTGCAFVALEDAEVHLERDALKKSGMFNSAPPELERVLAEKYGESSKGRFLNRRMRYFETVLEEGDELYVLGRVMWRDEGPAFVDGNPVFVVSDQGETRVAARYLWRALGLATLSEAALALSMFSAYMILID